MNARSRRFCCAPNGSEGLSSTSTGLRSLSCSLISFRSTGYYGTQLSLGPGELLLVRFRYLTLNSAFLTVRICITSSPFLLLLFTSMISDCLSSKVFSCSAHFGTISSPSFEVTEFIPYRPYLWSTWSQWTVVFNLDVFSYLGKGNLNH
jgi:hypothetical protein